MAYDDQPRVPEDLLPGTVMLVVAVTLLIAMLVAGATGMPASCDDQKPEDPVHSALVLDLSNAAAMHAYGLPTKEDVMEYHLHGQWAYKLDGELKAFDELPGRPGRWDVLYGIDPDNPAFDK